MNYLDKIIEHKRTEVAQAKAKVSIKELQYYKNYGHQARSLANHIVSPLHNGIIAEFKRQSPSKGVINANADVAPTVRQYQQAGVSGISVLTDSKFFGGTGMDLSNAFDAITIPIIRKEFIIDPWQIYEARALGASAILLIAAVLTKKEAVDLAATANFLGLEVLMEFHDRDELEKLNAFVDIAGINNRSLKTFEVNLQHSIEMASLLPDSLPKVAESGIDSPETIAYLRSRGFDGFLIGESFMKQENPGAACIEFCKQQQTAKR
jgi:indole-3-glycerol phosphate synthase